MAGSELLEAALLYASLGWRVFPLKPRDKTPAHKGWQEEATTDPERIRGFWRENPRYNVGIKTGDGLCVIDVDDKPEKHGGVLGSDVLRDWELEHGDIAETVCCKTPTGGMHYYYDIGDARVRKCEGLPELSIDLRCDGGLIVAPPSVHPETGTAYEWDISPEDMEVAKAGRVEKACIQWVWDNSIEAKKDSSGKTDTSIPAGKIKEGEGRNTWLFTQGRSARGKGADDDTIAAFLTALNQTKCSPPLDDAELWKTIGSVCSKPAGMSKEAKAARGRPKRFDHAAVAEKLIKDNGACFVDGMPAIRHGDVYEVGWNAVSREIIAMDKNATRTNQKEVHHYLTIEAPQRQQSRPTLIAFENGVLDVETMELRGWRDDDVIPNIIPHKWDPDAECPEVDNVLLKMACGEPDILESLIEVMGVCMYRSAEFTQSAILLGEGSNGKSTYIRMLTALLGKRNISSLDMSMIGKQFHTGMLAGKLANLGDDISNEFQHGDLLSIFKKVVDGNRIFTDVKGTEGYEFEPYATLVFSANEFPRLADYTDGMIRRIFPIEFNAKFSKTDPDYDPRIAKKVTSERACQHMAVLGVMGLHQVFKNNGFTPNTASSRRVDEIMADNDTVLAWTLDNGWNAETLDGKVGAVLYESYKTWCVDCGLQAVKRTKFTRSINKHYQMQSTDEWVDGRTRKCFRSAFQF